MWPISMWAIGTEAIEEETDDELPLGTGRVISDGLKGDWQGLLEYGGERFFHLRYHRGFGVGGVRHVELAAARYQTSNILCGCSMDLRLLRKF